MPGVPGVSGVDAVGRARLALNRVTYARLNADVEVLVGAIQGMSEDEVGEVVDVLLGRAVHGDKGLYGKVAREVVKGDGGVFRKVLHNRCEVNFSRYAEQDEVAAEGLVLFMGSLFFHDVMSQKIIHTCLITLLFGPEVDKSSIPSPLSLKLACALFSLTPLLDPTKTHYYLRRLDHLKQHYPPTSPPYLLIEEALSQHRPNILQAPENEVHP